MRKEKFHIEYVFDKVSRRSLWNHLSTSPGLSAWFADDVNIGNHTCTFAWEKDLQEAELLAMKPEQNIRFRWKGEEDKHVYFEFAIHTEELTGVTSLTITDFATADEKEGAIHLWDSQVDELRRTLGV